MKFEEILDKLNKGKFIIWIDDKQDAKLTPEYMESHVVHVADSLKEGHEFCINMQTGERISTGRATTRYRISSLKEDYVCSEDLDQETVERLMSSGKGAGIED